MLYVIVGLSCFVLGVLMSVGAAMLFVRGFMDALATPEEDEA